MAVPKTTKETFHESQPKAYHENEFQHEATKNNNIKTQIFI